MAGANRAHSVRGKYSQAGYNGQEHARQMYIASVPAGSRQDKLRDLNRIGYQSDRPWNETPTPVFETGAAAVAAPRVRRREREQTLADRLMYYAVREKKDVVVCIVLIAMILMMAAAWGQKNMAVSSVRAAITSFEDDKAEVLEIIREKENELEIARNGERIRNLAQNELNMLRPERAITETIYIQMPENLAEKSIQNQEEPRMEMLDILLGLLNVFNIGE